MIRAKRKSERLEDRGTHAGLKNGVALGNLAEGTILGGIELLNILVHLSEEITQGEPLKASDDAFSQAMAWSAEPEWMGESSEALSETGAGSREPEGA
jgi:hypothetical protein